MASISPAGAPSTDRASDLGRSPLDGDQGHIVVPGGAADKIEQAGLDLVEEFRGRLRRFGDQGTESAAGLELTLGRTGLGQPVGETHQHFSPGQFDI